MSPLQIKFYKSKHGFLITFPYILISPVDVFFRIIIGFSPMDVIAGTLGKHTIQRLALSKFIF